MTDTTPSEPTAAAPATEPVTAPAEPAREASPWDDPAVAKAEIEKLRRENAADRTNAKARAAEEARASLAQEFGKILGLVKDDAPVDPQALIADAKRARVDLAVHRLAAAAQGDPIALLDSASFQAKVAALDPNDEAAISAAIAAAVEANPRLGVASPKAPAPNPAQAAAGSGVGAGAQITLAELDRMTPEQVVVARREGRLNHLMGA